MEAISVAIGRGPKSEGGRTYHDGEDALLHLTGVLCAEDDHLHTLEVDLNGSGRRHALCKPVCGELAGIVDDELRLAKGGKFLFRRTNEHIVLKSEFSAHIPTSLSSLTMKRAW